METKNEPKWTKQDLQRWKDNEFTKFFFERINEEMQQIQDAIVNLSVRNGNAEEIRHLGGRLLSLATIYKMDETNLLEVEDEQDRN